MALALWGAAHGAAEPARLELRFAHIGNEDGLVQSVVSSIVQDHRGFMWFGTQGGLNRFDGHSFLAFKSVPGAARTLSDNVVYAVVEGDDRTLWIGTEAGLDRLDLDTLKVTPIDLGVDRSRVLSIAQGGADTIWLGTLKGLLRFNPTTGAVRSFVTSPVGASGEAVDLVDSLLVDHLGELWVGKRHGLIRLDPRTGAMTRYLHDSQDPASLSHDRVQDIYEDRDKRLWIGTWRGGLNRYERDTDGFTRFRHDPDDPTSLSDDQVETILEDSRGSLWVGTWRRGLNRLNRATGEFERVGVDSPGREGIHSEGVWTIYEDRQQNLWVGTYGGGVTRIEHAERNFVPIGLDPDNPESKAPTVQSVHADDRGRVWIGTVGQGLWLHDAAGARIRAFRHQRDDPSSLADDSVRWISADPGDPGRYLWVGTNQGLDRLDVDTQRFEHFVPVPGDPGTGANVVFTVCPVRDGELMVGTAKGLFAFRPQLRQFKAFRHSSADPSSLADDVVLSLLLDSRGDLWVGTAGGLSLLRAGEDGFETYRQGSPDAGGLSNPTVHAVFEDREGRIWAGTRNGLNLFDAKNQRFSVWGDSQRLRSESIMAIEGDEAGRLWVSTDNGLARIDPSSNEVRAFDVADGLPHNEFWNGSSSSSSSGRLFFGALAGAVAFDPDDIRDSPFSPPVVITQLMIANERVPVGPLPGRDPILERTITATEELTLSHEDLVVTFEFAALDYSSPDRTRYAYMMEGFDESWNSIGERRYATYRRLPPARYTFRVRAGNSEGVWSDEEAILRLVVTPPFHETLPFRIAAILAVLLTVLGVHQLRTASIRRRNLQLRRHNLELNREISERVQAETALRESETRYRTLFDEVADPVFVFDSETNLIVDCNQQAIATYGYSLNELQSMTVHRLHVSEDLPAVERNLRSPKEGETHYYTHRTRSGALLNVEVRSTTVEDRGHELTVAVVHDVTERTASNLRLEGYSERLRRLRQIDQAILAARSPGEIAEAAMQHVGKLIPSTYAAVVTFDLAQDQAQLLAALNESTIECDQRLPLSAFDLAERFSSGAPLIVEDLARQADPPQWIKQLQRAGIRSYVAVPVAGRSNLAGLVYVCFDEAGPIADEHVQIVSELAGSLAIAIEQWELYHELEQRVAERTVELARTNRELEAFSYSVSHDLRAPLRSIAGFSGAVLEDCADELSGTAAEHLNGVKRAATRMSHLIDSLLKLSRITRGGLDREHVDLSAVARSVSEELVSSQPDRQVAFDIADGVAVEGDRRLMQVVMQNLLGNAWKFSKRHERARIEFGIRTIDGEEAIFVRDNGCGFDMAYSKQLFAAFQRLHSNEEEYEGSGIGLATVQRIVTRHGGRIWAEGKVGEGATFNFTLPSRSGRRSGT